MQNKSIIIILISLFSITFSATGQKLINSPYSRFNLGTLEPAGSFRHLGMGGIGVSIRDNNSISYSNPASYSSLDTTSFVFDFGLDYGINVLSDGITQFSSEDLNFDHLLIGFPLAKGWGFAAGIIPVSNGYYKMYETVLEGDPGYDPLTGEYALSHEGEGGFTNFFLGSGINITRNLSVGVNMSILFGQINRENHFDFVDYYNVYNINSTENLHLSGTNFEYGIQYTKPLKNDYFLVAGFSAIRNKNYNSKYEQVNLRTTAYSTEDTIFPIINNSNKAYVPGTIKFGISVGKKDKITAGIDFITTKWSKSTIQGADGYMADSRSILFGAEYIPDKFSNYSYIRRIEYRIGGHSGNNYLIINGEQVKEYGASFGLGLPLRRTLSKANLFFDFTRKTGSFNNGLHNENYYSMGISLNLYDFWFVKRKYD